MKTNIFSLLEDIFYIIQNDSRLKDVESKSTWFKSQDFNFYPEQLNTIASKIVTASEQTRFEGYSTTLQASSQLKMLCNMLERIDDVKDKYQEYFQPYLEKYDLMSDPSNLYKLDDSTETNVYAISCVEIALQKLRKAIQSEYQNILESLPAEEQKNYQQAEPATTIGTDATSLKEELSKYITSKEIIEDIINVSDNETAVRGTFKHHATRLMNDPAFNNNNRANVFRLLEKYGVIKPHKKKDGTSNYDKYYYDIRNH